MSYWSERQKRLYSAMEKDEKALKKRLSSFYDAEYAQLDKQIASYYAKYGVDNVIKYRSLLESLPSEDVKLLMEQMEEFGKKYPQYSHLLPVRESIYKLDRLEGLQLSVRMQQLEIGAVNIEKITEHLNRQALRGLNSSAQAMGFGKNFYSANADIIKQFVNVPWSGGESFSQRIWQNTEKLAGYLNTDIAQGIARGETYEKLTKQLRSRFGNVSRRDAYRLIYTEGTYVMAESSMHAFEDDFDEYKISTVGDGKVCDICSGMARNRYKIKDREAGVNFPPFHPWCRCSFEIVVDDWDKWMDDYVAKHGGQSAGKVLNNLAENDKINHIVNDGVNDVHYIGKLDRDIYKCITDDITTDEVIITDERISHIKDHHSGHFEIIEPFLKTVIDFPDYILEDANNTGLILKHIVENDLRIQIVLRLHTSTDSAGFKNSIISAWKISEKRWNNYVNNKKILYKSE